LEYCLCHVGKVINARTYRQLADTRLQRLRAKGDGVSVCAGLTAKPKT